MKSKFIRTVPMKLYLILLAVVLFAFFSNDFGLVDIQKTAVILAAGIDRTEEGFSLTAQIAVPKGSDRSQGGTSSVEINARGETVSDCVSLLFAKTGWVPKLVFCNLIVLGEEAVKEDVISYLNYFLRNEYMNDSCLLAVCEGTAEELIASQSAIDDASSLAVVKLFSDASEKSGWVVKNTIKDFAIGYYGVSKSGFLPFVRAQTQEGAQEIDEDMECPPSEEPQKIYSAEETAIFSEGKMVALLPHEQTLAFSLLRGNVQSGTFNVDDGGHAVTLTMLASGGGVSLRTESVPKARLAVDVMLRFCCRGTTEPVEDVSSDKVSPELIKKAESTLEGYLEGLWKICKESGCDLLNLKRDLFRSSPKKFAAWKDNLLASAEAEFEAKASGKS